INVVNIHIPPIRQRREDIEPLVQYFIRKYCGEFRKTLMEIDSSALSVMLEYDWPGNVREIRNCVERAVLLTEGSMIRSQDISINHGQNPLPRKQESETMSSLALSERDIILEALRKNDWIQKEAACSLGISKRVIHYKIRKYGITHPRWIRNR
ncbi:MAG: helix-turn-helix domain-containing protein, partial [Desulfomonilia bacterium]|nr:helix-turn-helix domain-containing protein [Desulfomonilia bacterium]